MTDCPDCARAGQQLSGYYTANCRGCTARAIARSQIARHALHPDGPRDKEPLREAIARLLPELAYAEARAMVWHWWGVDHGIEDGAPAREVA